MTMLFVMVVMVVSHLPPPGNLKLWIPRTRARRASRANHRFKLFCLCCAPYRCAGLVSDMMVSWFYVYFSYYGSTISSLEERSLR
jgi:hypothetical protein